MDNIKLVKEYQEGNKEALEQLIVNNKRLVHFVARKFNGYDYEDLTQEGFIGLQEAAMTYKLDLENKCKFSTWAVYYIHNRIGRYIRQQQKFKYVSFEEPVSEDLTIGEMLPDEKTEKVFDRIINYELRQEIHQALQENLTLFEREVIKMSYGFYGGRCYSRQEIADIYNTELKEIRNAKNRSLMRLRGSQWGRKIWYERKIEKLSRMKNNTEQAALYRATKFNRL